MKQRETRPTTAQISNSTCRLTALLQNIDLLITPFFQAVITGGLPIFQALFTGEMLSKIVQLLCTTAIGDILTVADNAM